MARTKNIPTEAAIILSYEAENETKKTSEVEVSENIDTIKNPILEDKFYSARNPDGSINWRKMINPEYIILNRSEKKEEIERVYGKPIDELEIDKVDDKYKLILLQGIKDIAALRKFKSVKYPSIAAQQGFVSVYCEIEWMPFEDKIGESKLAETFGDGADASPDNTQGFTKNFLTAIAFNRAFVRAVKNYLGIALLGKDEIGPDNNQRQAEKVDTGPRGALQAKLDKANRSFEQFKNWWISLGNSDAENWARLGDIPSKDVWNILTVMKDLEEKRKFQKN